MSSFYLFKKKVNKMNKQYKVSVYVLALLLVCVVQTAGAVTVSVDDASSEYGTAVDIPINVSSTSNIGATDISLTYDPAVISPTGVVANGTLISATDLIANYTGTSGIVNVSVASTSGITDMGSIAVIQFSVVGSGNATSPLTLSRVNAYDLDSQTYDESGNCTGYAELDVTIVNATFTATGEGGLVKTGDIDASASVDFDDALYLARYTIFGAGSYPLYDDGDVNSDGSVDFDDALYLARYTIFGAGSYPLYP